MRFDGRVGEAEETILRAWRWGTVVVVIAAMFVGAVVVSVVVRIGETGVGIGLRGQSLTFLAYGEWGGGRSDGEDDGSRCGRVDGECVEGFLLGRVGGGSETYEARDGPSLGIFPRWDVEEGFTFVESIVGDAEVVSWS